MNLDDLRQLLNKSNNKLDIFGNTEILKQCQFSFNQLYELIVEFLTDSEKLQLFNYPLYMNMTPYKRNDILNLISDSKILLSALLNENIINGFSSFDLQQIVQKKLEDSEKFSLLNTPNWFKTHNILTYIISDIIEKMENPTKYQILSNKELVINSLHLENYILVNLVASLDNEEQKKSLLKLYDFPEHLLPDIVKTFSDKSKLNFLIENPKLRNHLKITIITTFSLDYLFDYMNNYARSASIIPYKITIDLEPSLQEQFIANLDKVTLTEHEKREIYATLKPEVKEKIDTSKLPINLVTALNMKATEYGGYIILDLNTDLENYRGLDRLLHVNPTRFDSDERTKFKHLCNICPDLIIGNTLDSKEDNEEFKLEFYSTATEYIEAEAWIESVLSKLKPEYTIPQKIAIIDNAIGKKISYSPDFDTEIFNGVDCRALYRIISSGYGVCNGIARVEQYMFEKAGIDCEIVGGGKHAFIKLKNIEFELENGETVVGTTILDPTWNLAAHRFGGKPDNFCINYEEARKNDIDSKGVDYECHKNDEKLEDATFSLDEKSLRKLFKSVGLANHNGDFPIKSLIDQSAQLHKKYANQQEKNIEEQFLLLSKVCPEFATCQDSTMEILKLIIFNNENFTFNKCIVNRVYNRFDNDKRPVMYVYIQSDKLGEKFYYADKQTGTFVYSPKMEFLSQFECYEKDLQNNDGSRPWEERSQEEKTNLENNPEKVVAHKEEGR
ncbi:MAG: hypothetical protein ILA02_03150 [Clostridia bacterium]|nr:hypothetical protein [Clostridia bacterium]